MYKKKFDDLFILYVNKSDTFSSIVLIFTTKQLIQNLGGGDAQKTFDDIFILYVNKSDTFSSIVLVFTKKRFSLWNF